MLKGLRIFFLGILMVSGVSLSLGADTIRCSTVEVFKRNALVQPDAIMRKQQLESDIRHWIVQNATKRENGIQAAVTIPVVVHVVYNTEAQNISEAQIQSQIDRLNKDFSNSNADKLLSTQPFFNLTGNAKLEFCLTRKDPDGNATSGITRTQTALASFSDNNDVKFSARGGADAWDATQYLNIWVCNLGGNLLGYAQFPSQLATQPETDGVVIGYKYFGTIGTVVPPYNSGRTATHEIGHWLNLEHIWGDDNDCSGTDHVADTPDQERETIGCPSGIRTDNCTGTSLGVMYQNYMDYTDDACMVLFTKGQVDRMNAVLDIVRPEIIATDKCSRTTGLAVQNNRRLKIYPNPIQNYLTIEGLPGTKAGYFIIDIFNALGEKVYTTEISSDAMIEMATLKTGTYVMNIYNDDFSVTKKLTVLK